MIMQSDSCGMYFLQCMQCSNVSIVTVSAV